MPVSFEDVGCTRLYFFELARGLERASGWLHLGRLGAHSLHSGRVGVSRAKKRKSSTNLKFKKF